MLLLLRYYPQTPFRNDIMLGRLQQSTDGRYYRGILECYLSGGYLEHRIWEIVEL
jgi:hypothetical protein